MKRFLSLDVLRGLTIFLMLLVNNIALDTNTPGQLLHASWNSGLTLADFVFPWFLFCIGVSIPFSRASFLKKPRWGWLYELKIVRRAALIFLLGVIIESSIARQPYLSLGVLQLLALAYLASAFFYDLPFIRRILLAALMLGLYWALLKYLPIPGIGAGIFEADRNIIAHFNSTYFRQFNLSGLISVVPTAALALIGTLFGDILMKDTKNEAVKTLSIILFGTVIAVLGYLWGLDVPLNKSLWTPSFILLTGGSAAVLLGFFHIFADIFNWKYLFLPLTVFGSNAIFAYAAPILVKTLILENWHINIWGGQSISVQQWLYSCFFGSFGRINGGWLYTIAYVSVWWLILMLMHIRKVFIRL